MAEPNTRDAKLIQYLVEAHGKERELETALQAHIAMTTHKPYRKRLQQHLSETKRHARETERRVKRLGGKLTPTSADSRIPDAAAEAVGTATSLAKKGVALAQGPLHMIRGTGEPEKMLKNAKSEYSDEAEEIATYRAIETLATAVGDKETAQLAKSIRRDEERMAQFLERQIDTLTKQVVRDEIPASERSTGRRRSTAKRRSTSASTSRSRKPSTGRAKSASKRRSTSSRAAGSRTKARSRRSPARASSNGARASSSRSRSARSRSTRARSGSGS